MPIIRTTARADAILAVLGKDCGDTILHALPFKYQKECGWSVYSKKQIAAFAKQQGSDMTIVYLGDAIDFTSEDTVPLILCQKTVSTFAAEKIRKVAEHVLRHLG